MTYSLAELDRDTERREDLSGRAGFLFCLLYVICVAINSKTSVDYMTSSSYQKAEVNKKGVLVVKTAPQIYEWVGYAQHGFQEGKTSKRALFISLACDDTKDAGELAQNTFKINQDVSKLVYNLWNRNNEAFRELLEIPLTADVVVHPSGTYNDTYKSMSIFPHTKWTTYLEEAEPEPITKNYAYFLAMDDDKRSSDIAISMNVNTIHFEATDASVNKEAKERKWEVIGTPFMNIKKLIVSRSDVQSTQVDLERERAHTMELSKKLKSRKRKAAEENDSGKNSSKK